jgi:methyl-accepting chemotaxis protein
MGLPMQDTEKQMRSDTDSRKRRRQLIVNPSFQWRYTGLIMLGIFVATAFMSIMLFGALLQQARARVVYPEAPGTFEYTFIIFISALAFSTVTAGAFGLFSIVFTQRMCGPVSVISQWLEDVAAGRIPKIRPLRRKDEFQELYESFARAIDSLRKSRQEEQLAVAHALAMVQSALDSEDHTRKEALETVVVQLQSLRHTVSDALDTQTAEAIADLAAKPRPPDMDADN